MTPCGPSRTVGARSSKTSLEISSSRPWSSMRRYNLRSRDYPSLYKTWKVWCQPSRLKKTILVVRCISGRLIWTWTWSNNLASWTEWPCLGRKMTEKQMGLSQTLKESTKTSWEGSRVSTPIGRCTYMSALLAPILLLFGTSNVSCVRTRTSILKGCRKVSAETRCRGSRLRSPH